jgi:mono/diheme cytochrome c family protein
MKWRFGKPAMWLVLVGIAALATPMAAQRRRPNRPPPVDLPKGPVREIILRNCTACHGIDDYAFFALDRAGWQSLLETKHKSGGAVLSDQDRNTLLDYLTTKFGPNSQPFKPPQGQARPAALVNNDEVVGTASADIATRKILDTACTACHMLDQVYAARYTEEKWRELVSEMRNKGARLSDGDIDALVEYFARTQGTN